MIQLLIKYDLHSSSKRIWKIKRKSTVYEV